MVNIMQTQTEVGNESQARVAQGLLVDSHCHLDFDELRVDLPQVLARARAAQVGHMLCVSVNLEDYPRIQAIARENAHIFASVGVHPNHHGGREPSAAELIELAGAEEVVALGETGLDYFRAPSKEEGEGEEEGEADFAEVRRVQQKRFANHIEAARAVNKPLIIHTRAAAEDTMDMLENLQAEECGGVMHCFTENWATAKRALDIGFYISISGIVTFKNAETVKQTAKKVPLERLLVETDAPYLAPVPFRGKTNEPSFVRHTAEYLAELRGISLGEVAEATSENFFRLFGGARRAIN